MDLLPKWIGAGFGRFQVRPKQKKIFPHNIDIFLHNFLSDPDVRPDRADDLGALLPDDVHALHRLPCGALVRPARVRGRASQTDRGGVEEHIRTSGGEVPDV